MSAPPAQQQKAPSELSALIAECESVCGDEADSTEHAIDVLLAPVHSVPLADKKLQPSRLQPPSSTPTSRSRNTRPVLDAAACCFCTPESTQQQFDQSVAQMSEAQFGMLQQAAARRAGRCTAEDSEDDASPASDLMEVRVSPASAPRTRALSTE